MNSNYSSSHEQHSKFEFALFLKSSCEEAVCPLKKTHLFQINPRMAWLSGFADKAETFLNQIDRGAADALNTSNINKSNLGLNR